MATAKKHGKSAERGSLAPSASGSSANIRSAPGYQRSTSQMSPVDESGPYSPGARSTSTVRRLPTENVEGYGTIPSSVETFNTARERTGPEHEHQPEGRVSRRPSQASLRKRGSQADLKQQRLSRRPSSAVNKRQGFSAEDDAEEVEEDREQQRTYSSGHVSGARRPPNLRRRTQASIREQDSGKDEETANDEDVQGLDDDSADIEDGTARGDAYQPSEAGSAESFTLKDRQQAINETHPFGIRIWKPAIYKKNRSVQRTAEGDIHSAPGGSVGPGIFFANILWLLFFGWWMSIATGLAGAACYCMFFSRSTREYGRVFLGLSRYLLYPFGRFIELRQEEAYAEEDEGEGRSITEYEQWQAGDLEAGRTFFGPVGSRSRTIVGRRRDSLDTVSETQSLLGASERTGLISGNTNGLERKKTRFFGRGQWNFGRVLFYALFYTVVAPILILVSGACWFLVFTIPMAKVTYLLFDHLRRHPLALSFHSDSTYTRRPGTPSSSILVCTYRAVGWKYYKYTIDGTNIFFINLMTVVIFVIVDYFFLDYFLEADTPLTSPGVMFTLGLFSVIPLAYFIGQAVASISAQSSMGVGATVNAFFSTVVEVFLYCVALKEGKGRLVEGSIVGSILAGVSFMPGLSMCSGALKRKTQRFNARSAGVTSTMLLFAVIGAFAPTLFYQIYGTYELSCRACTDEAYLLNTECRRCYFSQTPPTGNDSLYKNAVQPYTYAAAVFLVLSYVVGLMFTLRTHAAMIWQVPPASSAPATLPPTEAASRNHLRQHLDSRNVSEVNFQHPVRDTRLYKHILGQSLNEMGVPPESGKAPPSNTLHMVPPHSSGNDAAVGPTDVPADNAHLIREVTEAAAAAAAAAVQDVQRHPPRRQSKPTIPNMPSALEEEIPVGGEAAGGHDAPNWGRAKSAVILLGATVLYAIVAEILVDTVDVVLENWDIDEKFLGFTLFALVPNTTEFLNAISFAMNGNIALSMEIGSAYALQVCLLQIPALVGFSAFYAWNLDADQIIDHTFNLIFPQWDLVCVILCVFLLAYMYGEGKSNYFKGSILILSYLTVTLGFYFASYARDATHEIHAMVMGVGPKGQVYRVAQMAQ